MSMGVSNKYRKDVERTGGYHSNSLARLGALSRGMVCLSPFPLISSLLKNSLIPKPAPDTHHGRAGMSSFYHLIHKITSHQTPTPNTKQGPSLAATAPPPPIPFTASPASPSSTSKPNQATTRGTPSPSSGTKSTKQ
jgi:hypothetical protein